MPARVASGVRALVETRQIVPGLTVILVGADPASEVYVGRKVRQTRKVGMRSIEHRLPEDTDEADCSRLSRG